jgi:hypothetical protein
MTDKIAKTFAELAKDITPASVHVPTAIGNEKDPKKVKKTDFEVDFIVSKADAEQQLIFGWASVSMLNGKNVIDKHNDIIEIDVLEKAAYDFVLNSREGDDMHTSACVSKCVESMMFTPEKAALGLVAKNEKGEQIYGWFTGWHVENETVWKDYKAGKRPELSIGGLAHKVKV